MTPDQIEAERARFEDAMLRLRVDGNVDGGTECPCYERKDRDDLERHAAE